MASCVNMTRLCALAGQGSMGDCRGFGGALSGAMSPDRLLSDIFGFDGFRPGQAEIVDAIMAGRDVLAIMPTGGGKSLCFQLPALARDGLTVVISPLIALMRDQVRGLREAGVAAGALTSGNTEAETEEVFAALEDFGEGDGLDLVSLIDELYKRHPIAFFSEELAG